MGGKRGREITQGNRGKWRNRGKERQRDNASEHGEIGEIGKRKKER
jgi:hypothetical protein